QRAQEQPLARLIPAWPAWAIDGRRGGAQNDGFRRETPRATPIPAEKPMKRSLATLALAAALAACSTTSPDVIQRGDAQRLSQVQDATVLSVRPVTVEGTQSGMGGAAGGVIGGVAGSSVGGHREQIAVGVLGAVAGAVIGNLTERAATRESAVEIL